MKSVVDTAGENMGQCRDVVNGFSRGWVVYLINRINGEILIMKIWLGSLDSEMDLFC